MKFQSHIGLDIGASTIKIVQLSPSGNKFKLSSIGVVESPQSDNQSERDLAESNVIKKTIQDCSVSSKLAVVSLPESQVYTRVVEMPFLEEPELSSAIVWQAEQYIPVPLTDVTLKHQVLSLPETGVPGSKMNVLLVAAPNKLIGRYMSILARAGLEVLAIETEIFAVARSLLSLEDSVPNTLLVNFGQDNTTLAVMKKGEVALTQSISSGAMALTRALTTNLNLETPQAEEYKRAYGLDSTKLDGKVYSVLAPVVDMYVTEIKKTVTFHETRAGSTPIKRVVLAGGTALLPGLAAYLTTNLNMEVQIGNPFNNIELTNKQREVVFASGPMFAAAVGLGMKKT